MSDLSAAKRMIEKIKEDADAGLNGSASFALDRLTQIRQLADMALRKISNMKEQPAMLTKEMQRALEADGETVFLVMKMVCT